MVICLERRADDLHMVQLMPLPPRDILLYENPEWFTFWCRFSQDQLQFTVTRIPV